MNHRTKSSIAEGVFFGTCWGLLAWAVSAGGPIVYAWARSLDPWPLSIGGCVALIAGTISGLWAWHIAQ